MKRIVFTCLILLVALTGCEKKKEAPETAAKSPPAQAVDLTLPTPKMLFNEPMTAEVYELPTEALKSWRHTKSAKPALILFSIHPFLDPIAEDQKADIATLIESGDGEAFVQRGSFYRLDPAIVPTQAVSAAINNDMFSELIWVIPTRSKVEELSLEIFTQQVVDAGFLTEEEGKALRHEEGVTSGVVRGLPFRAVHPDAMPDLTEPVVVHIDTGYFKGLFKNEVATPLYDILHQTIMRISQSEWKVYATTLSWSTRELMFSLDVRFLVTALAKIIEDPELIQNMPQSWRLHADAMYMGNMYMETKSRDLIEEAAVADPNNPAIVYALAKVRFQQGRADEAFTLLDKAVELDPGYAVEYQQLALTGAENGQFEKALELQRKAVKAYPENPFLQVREAELLIQSGKNQEAIQLLNGLQMLPWSTYYHPNALASLSSIVDYANNPTPAEEPQEIQ